MLMNAGRFAHFLGEYGVANEYYDAASALFTSAKFPCGVLWRPKADIAAEMGDFENARTLARQSMADELGYYESTNGTLCAFADTLALIATSEGYLSLAATILGAADADNVRRSDKRWPPDQTYIVRLTDSLPIRMGDVAYDDAYKRRLGPFGAKPYGHSHALRVRRF